MPHGKPLFDYSNELSNEWLDSEECKKQNDKELSYEDDSFESNESVEIYFKTSPAKIFSLKSFEKNKYISRYSASLLAKPFSILFVDHERLVVGMETQSCTFFANEEYGIKLSFSIKRGPILTRDIFVTSIVNKIYRSGDGLYSCVDFRYTTLQEEDLRFLYEKATSTLFN